MSHQIGLILLAAGGSSRMGRPKQLLPFQGRTLLAIAVDHALKSSCRPIVVVLGAEFEACQKELREKDITIARNDAWAAGMGTSIRAGISQLLAMSPQIAGAMLMLCDQPKIDAAAIDLFTSEFRNNKKDLMAARYGDSLGVPALFSRKYFPQLQSLPNDKGAKAILLKHRDVTAAIDLPDAAFDIDTPEDYSKL